MKKDLYWYINRDGIQNTQIFLSINAYISFFPDDFAMITVNERKDGFTRRKIM